MDKKYVSGLMVFSVLGSSMATQAAEGVADTSISASSPGRNEALNFDLDMLRLRGIDPSVAQYFAHSARFSPGSRVVEFSLNGKLKGSIPVVFDAQGQPCVGRSFLQAAGLKIPRDVADPAQVQGESESQTASITKDTICYDYAAAYPGTVFSLFPAEDRIALVTPPEAVRPELAQTENYHTGGTAALLNYSLFSSRSSYSGGSSSYNQGMFEAGFNTQDLMIRSRQSISESNGKINRNALYTYGQRSFAGIKKIAQAGQINISNTLFSGSAIDGVQFIPETALDDGSMGSGVDVTGIAQAAQSRVDIKQGGSLIYSTLVPAGPFTLTNIPVVSANTDLDVTITEPGGASSHFTVLAASLSGSRLGRPQGLSVAVGKMRDVSADFAAPWLATASTGWQAMRKLNLSAGLLGAEKYQSVAGGTEFIPFTNLMLSSRLLASQDKRHNNRGEQLTLSASYSAPHNLSFSVSGSKNSRGYRDLYDTFNHEDTVRRNKNDYSFSTGWSNSILGGFSLGYSRSVGFDGNGGSKRMMASWGKSFKYASVSANWQRQLSSSDHSRNSGRDDSLYLSVNIPLGPKRQSVNTYARKNGQDTRYGMQTSGSISRDVVYSLSAENSNPGSRNGINGGLNANLHYTRMSLNAGGDNNHSRNTSATLDGGIVMHGGGVTFSPYAVQDTFGIASLGEHVAGIEISTPQGVVWTDLWGQAVVPSLNPYRNSNVMVNTETLPKNVDVNNGIKTLNTGRGSVSKLKFGVMTVRRAMLKLLMPDSKPVPKGTVIFDAHNQYVTTAVDHGVVFLNDMASIGELFAATDEAGHKCRLNFALTDNPDLHAFYEKVAATCQVQ